MAYDKVLDVPWHAYRTWAGTARFLKGDLNPWTRYTLMLAIIGAILAAAGQEFGVLIVFGTWPMLARSTAVLASFAVALSAYDGWRSIWPRSRIAAGYEPHVAEIHVKYSLRIPA